MELFIRAVIGDKSPSSRLFATFLHKRSAQALQAPRGSRVRQGAAHSCRSDGICAMLVGSVPLNLLS